MAEPKKVFIFDFDGTLADSAPIIRSIYTDLAAKKKWKVLTDEDYEMLRHGTIRDARRWSGIPIWQYPLLVRAVKKLMTLEAEKVSLFPGTAELVKKLHGHNSDLYVLSRNAPSTIYKVFERYGIEDKIQVLNRRKRSFGSKAAAITELIRKKKYDKKHIWMIGDEVRDIQAAKSAGVNSVAIEWGIQDISILERFEPTKVAATVSELQQILLEKR